MYDVVEGSIQNIFGLVFSIIPLYDKSIGVNALTSSENDAEVKTREPVSAVLFESGPAISWKVDFVCELLAMGMPYANCRKCHASDRALARLLWVASTVLSQSLSSKKVAAPVFQSSK
jgi:hypothetical protein